MSSQTVTRKPEPKIGADLPLAVAAALIGTKWETPLRDLQPRR